MKLCIAEPRALKLRVVERSALKLRVSERHALKLRLVEPHALEIRVIELRALKICLVEIRALQVRVLQIDLAQISTPENRAFEMPIFPGDRLLDGTQLRIVDFRGGERVETRKHERVGKGAPAPLACFIIWAIEQQIVERRRFGIILLVLCSEPGRDTIWWNPLLVADVLIQPFSRKGCRRKGNANRGEAAQQQPLLRPSAWPRHLASAVNHGGPKRPQKKYVNENENAMQPSDAL